MKIKYLLATLAFVLSFVSTAQAVWVVTEDKLESGDEFNDYKDSNNRNLTVHFTKNEPSLEEGATVQKVNKTGLASNINAKTIGCDKLESIYFINIKPTNIDSLLETLRNLSNITEDVTVKALNASDSSTLQSELDRLVEANLNLRN